MNPRNALLVPVLIALAAAAAEARGGVEAMLRRASKAEVVEAAEIYGKVVPMIRSNLYAEKRVAKTIEDLLEKAERTGPVELQKALAAMLAGMDHERSGAYVSAHALAREALITATRHGEFGAVPVAARVLTTYARGRQRGLAAKMMADYADGLLTLTSEDRTPETTAKGVEKLEVAFAVCVEQKWMEMATVVGTELAAAHLAAKKPGLARAVLERAATVRIGSYVDRETLILWDAAVERRLADAPPEALAPMERVREQLKRTKPADGGAGGAGEPGADAGEDPTTELGKAWRRLRRNGSVVRAKRGSISLTVELAYPREKQEETVQHRVGCRFKRFGDVALAIHGMAVALEQVNRKAPADGLPGGGPVRSRFKAWTLLAKGETWAFCKDGQVRIR
jgi:hypothetical protein